MPPRQNQKRGATDDKSPAGKKTKNDSSPELTEEEMELANQVIGIYQAFLRCSLDWTGGDDDLEFKRSKPSLVKGKSFADPDQEDELLVITRKGEDDEPGEPFTEEFLLKIHPKVVEVVNKVVDANNTWLDATNGHEAHLTQDDVEAMLKLFLNPEVTDDMNADDEDQGIRNGSIGFRRASGNAIGRWDFTEPCPDEIIEEYKKKPKGKGKKISPVK